MILTKSETVRGFKTRDIEGLIEQARKGKCVEIYAKNGDMVYFSKDIYASGNIERYIYGCYYAGNNDEYICDSIEYDEISNLLIFDNDTNVFLEKRMVSMENIERIYIGDEWSN